MLWLRRTYKSEKSPEEVYEMLSKYTEPNKYRVQMFSEALFIGTVKQDRFKVIPNKLFAKSRHGANITVSGRIKKTDTGTKIVAWSRPSLLFQGLFFILYLVSLFVLFFGGESGVPIFAGLFAGISVILILLFLIPVRNGLRDVQTVLDKRR